MLKIGDFARLARISSRILRHYDRLGLLTPAQVDPATGYRWYHIDQLPRLQRLRALHDLGFARDEIAILLDTPAPVNDVRAVLDQARATLRERIAADQARLLRVEARLRALDQPRAPATRSTRSSAPMTRAGRSSSGGRTPPASTSPPPG